MGAGQDGAGVGGGVPELQYRGDIKNTDDYTVIQNTGVAQEHERTSVRGVRITIISIMMMTTTIPKHSKKIFIS